MKRLDAFILAGLAGCAAPEPDRQSLKAELKREILAELREAPAAEPSATPVSTGKAQGRLVFKGAGVPGCRAKLVRLLESDTFLGMFREVRQGAEFEALTDEEGRFSFGNVPSGRYRLMWQVPGDTGWIRRAREAPDAVIEPGRAAEIPEVRLERRPVGTVER